MEDILINKKCPNCHSENISPYLETTSFRKMNIHRTYQFFLCNSCEIIFLVQDGNPDKHLYNDDYHCYRGLIKNKKFIHKTMDFGLKKRVKIVLRYKKTGRLLDVGCATGEFLNEFRSIKNWELYGVEPNQKARVYAQNLGELKIYPDLIKANFKDNFFDVITLWDVIEHIETISDLLIELNRIIKKNGTLIIKTPNPLSAEARLFRNYWSGLETPWHVFLFPKNTLIKLLSDNGFYNIKFHNPNIDYNTFFRSISNIFILNNYKILLNVSNYLFYRYPFKLFFNLLLRLLRALNFNSSITLSAIRKN